MRQSITFNEQATNEISSFSTFSATLLMTEVIF